MQRTDIPDESIQQIARLVTDRVRRNEEVIAVIEDYDRRRLVNQAIVEMLHLPDVDKAVD